MDKKKYVLSMVVILFICNLGVAEDEPNKPSGSKSKSYPLAPFIDYGIDIPAPGLNPFLADPNDPRNYEEALYATYSFSNEETIYNVEFYYRPLYSRVRVRVFVGDRELHGLYNRFYDVDPVRSDSAFVTWREGSIHLTCLNSGGLFLTESPLNTDVMYDALEAYIGKTAPQKINPDIELYPPQKLLKKTCMASASNYYLIDEEGLVEPLTIENLQKAYYKEGIKAKTSEDYEKITMSMIETEAKTARCDLKIISDVNDIWKRWGKALESENYEKIKPPWLYRDKESGTDYWNCYIVRKLGTFGPITAERYKLGFQNGQLISAEKTIFDNEKKS